MTWKVTLLMSACADRLEVRLEARAVAQMYQNGKALNKSVQNAPLHIAAQWDKL